MCTDDSLLRFVWDNQKNNLNLKKHKLSFETAARIFLDPNYIDIYDEEHSSDSEERHIVIGRVYRVLFVVCIFQEQAIRLISARIATKEEENLYYGRFL